MTSKLKCPFCQKGLSRGYNHDRDTVIYHCNNCYFQGDGIIWQALIQAKQDLEQYEHKDNLQQQLNANNNQIQENYKQIVEIDERIIENLEKDLQTAVQALKDIQTAQGRHWGATDTDIKNDCKYCARKALELIEHKE